MDVLQLGVRWRGQYVDDEQYHTRIVPIWLKQESHAECPVFKILGYHGLDNIYYTMDHDLAF